MESTFTQCFAVKINEGEIKLAVQTLFNLNSAVLTELIEGRTIERVPGVDYYVIAGTRPYDFTELLGIINDGVVAVQSAQSIGNVSVNDQCNNYWEIGATHTGLLANNDSRKIVERIVAAEIASSLKDKPIIGHTEYYELNIDSCMPDDQYIVVGVKLAKGAEPSPGLCACGNDICGVDENEVNCPSDCAEIREPAALPLDFLFRILKPLIWLLLIIIVGLVTIYLITHYIKTHQKHQAIIAAKHRHDMNIANYIRKALGKGFKLKDIGKRLLKEGWKKEHITKHIRKHRK